MLLRPVLALSVSLAAATGWAEVMVQPKAEGRLDLRARAAPLSEVLDRLARQTGMKVVYEGAAPRQLVTLTLVDRLPAEAVTAVLEGLGVNYALVGDETGTLVQTLMITGSAPAAAAVARSAAPPVRPTVQPQSQGPDTSEVFDDEGDEPVPFAPAEQLPPPSQPPAMVTGDARGQQPSGAPGAGPGQENPAQPFTPPAGSQALPPTSPFSPSSTSTSPFSPSSTSSSPFTPQPAMPQPQFPPPAQPQQQPGQQPPPGQAQPPSTP